MFVAAKLINNLKTMRSGLTLYHSLHRQFITSVVPPGVCVCVSGSLKIESISRIVGKKKKGAGRCYLRQMLS